MKQDDLRERTKQFALRVMKMVGQLPHNSVAQVIGNQVLRSGTSVAANDREGCRARTRAEMISKFGIVAQELDETLLWLELLVEGSVVSADKMALLMGETDELLRMITASLKTLKRPTAASRYTTTS